MSESNPAKQRLLRDYEEKRDRQSRSIRSLCSKRKFYYGTVHIELQKPATGAAIISSS